MKAWAILTERGRIDIESMAETRWQARVRGGWKRHAVRVNVTLAQPPKHKRSR